MLKKRSVILFLACLVAVRGAYAQGDTRGPELWWTFSPGAELPLGLNSSYYTIGAGFNISAEYLHPALAGVGILANAAFRYVPLSVPDVGGILVASPSVGAAYQLQLFRGFSARAFADVGFSYVGVYEHVNGNFFWNGDDAFTQTGIGFAYNFTPSLALRLEASYLYFFNLYGGMNLSLGIAFTTSKKPESAAPLPSRPRLLDISQVTLGSIFPVFYAFYDEHQIGTAVVKNTGSRPLTDVRVSFLMKQYMDGPKECAMIARLDPGETREVPVYGLFKSSILEVTEPTKVTAEIDADYEEENGSRGQSSETATLRVYDRNAMTWDDDRKAAAFVSAKDPWVLALSNNTSAMVRDSRNPGVDKNLQTAIAFHNALRVYGLAYSPNPSTPYSYTSKHPEVVDFLKFPRQTLTYRAGDCSDLSILYASFFESVGIETAFITVPGHIFMAISLDMSPEQAKTKLPDSNNLIFFDGKAWLPIETTIRDKGLLEAWREAANEWHQGLNDKTAAFYPIRDAWKVYHPVGLAADATSPQQPAQDLVTLAFSAELSHRVDQELAWLIAPLNDAIQKAPTPKALNTRGVAFARYGQLDKAESDFHAALNAKGDYLFALLNLGNLARLRSDDKSAYDYYGQAVRAAPGNPRALLGLASAAGALGRNDEAGTAYASAKKIDPELAATFAAPGLENEAGTRAAAQGARPVEWVQE